MPPHNWDHSRPTHVPPRVRTAALIRDGNRCTATMRDNTRCTETTKLEAHEVVQWQQGRQLTIDDVVMLCHWHHNKITQQQARASRTPRTNRRPGEQHPGLR